VECATPDTNIRRAANGLNSEFQILHFFDEHTVLAFNPPDPYLLCPDRAADDAVHVPLLACDAAEHIEAEAGVLGKRVTRQVRFGQNLQSGHTTGRWEAMPDRGCDSGEPSSVENGAEERLERADVTQRRRVAPGGFNDPFDPDGRGQSW